MANKIIPKRPVLKKADSLHSVQREQKILYIAQAHVAPGLSLDKWRRILARHGVDLKVNNPWPQVSDQSLERLFAELQAEVRHGH
ncbi:MAG: hypothetical protein U0401_31650 [Anaerolineae bacterium]